VRRATAIGLTKRQVTRKSCEVSTSLTAPTCAATCAMPGVMKPRAASCAPNPHPILSNHNAQAVAGGCLRDGSNSVSVAGIWKMPGDVRARHIARRAGCRQPPAGAPQRAAFAQDRKTAARISPGFTARTRKKSLNRRHFVLLQPSCRCRRSVASARLAGDGGKESVGVRNRP
jgi:hypothetical protein